MKRKKICGIYCIKNKINGKRYIGRSKDILTRKWDHFGKLRRNCHKNNYLQNAWNKYGENNFTFYLIKKYPKRMLSNREKYYIKKYKTNNSKYGYNETSGGEGSDWKLGKKNTPEQNRKIRMKRLGAKMSEETKEKIRNSMLGKKNPFYGKHHKKESIRKIKEAISGKNNIWYGTDFTGINNPGFGIKRKGRSSKYFGVCIHRIKRNRTDKYYSYLHWRARVIENGIEINLGIYKREIDAAKTYDKYIISNKLPNPLNFPIKKGVKNK